MTELTPQQIADLWFLRFGRAWVRRDELPTEWHAFTKELRRTGYLQYEMLNDPNRWGMVEIYKIKENDYADS